MEREPPFGAGSDPSNVVDVGYPIGSMQVPGGIEPIILLNDAVTGGGYVTICTVISADRDRLAQTKTHDRTRFRAVEHRRGAQARAERRTRLDAVRAALSEPEELDDGRADDQFAAPRDVLPAPVPGRRAVVNEGDTVRSGDVIGLVEVMKPFHEVKADQDGVVDGFLSRTRRRSTPGTTSSRCATAELRARRRGLTSLTASVKRGSPCQAARGVVDPLRERADAAGRQSGAPSTDVTKKTPPAALAPKASSAFTQRVHAHFADLRRDAESAAGSRAPWCRSMPSSTFVAGGSGARRARTMKTLQARALRDEALACSESTTSSSRAVAGREQRLLEVEPVIVLDARISNRAVDPRIKNYHWLDFEQALLSAYDAGGDNVVLSDGKGLVTEGAGFNVFIVRAGVLQTPATNVLEGITRHTVLEIARELGIPTEVGEVSVDALRNADEAFGASTAGGVFFVTSVDGAPLGDGRIGPLTQRIHDTYWAWHGDPRFTLAVSDVPPFEL